MEQLNNTFEGFLEKEFLSRVPETSKVVRLQLELTFYIQKTKVPGDIFSLSPRTYIQDISRSRFFNLLNHSLQQTALHLCCGNQEGQQRKMETPGGSFQPWTTGCKYIS